MPLHPQQAVKRAVRRFVNRLRAPSGLEVVLFVVFVALAALLWRGRRARKRAAKSQDFRGTESVVRDLVQPTQFKGYADRQTPDLPAGDAHLLAPGESIKVAGREIQAPFLWAAGGSEGVREPSALVPRLPAAPGKAEALGYWPSYSRMTPAQRAQHLDWLAANRPLDQSELGYVFTYFYGLEAAVARGLDREQSRMLVKEVLRLRAGYAHSSRSFERYSRSLLLEVLARDAGCLRVEQLTDLLESSGKLDESQLDLILHGLATRGHGVLSADAARFLARWLPDAKRSVVVSRAREEFERLFHLRFDEAWPAGMDLRAAKRLNRYAWYPANSSIEGKSIEDLPSYLGLKSQFRGIVEIWNRCISELSAFSRVLGKTDGDRANAAAFEALPDDLRETVDHPQAVEVRALLQGREQEGAAMVRVGELAQLQGLAQRDRLTMPQSRKLAAWIEAVGWSVVPDVRHGGRAYHWDAPLALFQPQNEDPVRADHFAPATLTLRAAWQVAHADGAAELHEVDVIRAHLASAMELNPAEQERLLLLERVLVEQQQAETGLLKRLHDALTPEGREAVARLLCAVAAADGEVSAPERKALLKALDQLEVAPSLMDEVLPSQAEPQTPAAESATEASPGVQLDRARIDAILADTADVQRVLADAMAVEEEEELEAEPELEPVATSNAETQPRFPEHLAEFGEYVLTQSEWQREELDAWARERGQMLSGMIEMLNDWSMEHCDDWLLEESGDRIHVLPETLELVA